MFVTLPVFNPAFQLRIDRRNWFFTPSLICSAMIPSNDLVPFICLYLSTFAVTPLWHPSIGSRTLVSSTRGSSRPGGTPKVFVSSASVSSDSQDSAGASHGFLALRTILRAGSVRVRLCNISSSSRGTPPRGPSPLFSQHHGSSHASVLRFSFHHHCDMLYKAP